MHVTTPRAALTCAIKPSRPDSTTSSGRSVAKWLQNATMPGKVNLTLYTRVFYPLNERHADLSFHKSRSFLGRNVRFDGTFRGDK
jgi:hypothetical protein